VTKQWAKEAAAAHPADADAQAVLPEQEAPAPASDPAEQPPPPPPPSALNPPPPDADALLQLAKLADEQSSFINRVSELLQKHRLESKEVLVEHPTGGNMGPFGLTVCLKRSMESLGESSGHSVKKAAKNVAYYKVFQNPRLLEVAMQEAALTQTSLSPAGTTAEAGGGAGLPLRLVIGRAAAEETPVDRQLLFDILGERNEHFRAKLGRMLTTIGEQLSAEEVVEFARSVRVLHEQQGGASAGRRFHDGLYEQVAAVERARAVAAEAGGDVILDDMEGRFRSGVR